MPARQYLLKPKSVADLKELVRTIEQHRLLSRMSSAQRSQLNLLLRGDDLEEGVVVPVSLRPHLDKKQHALFVSNWLGPFCASVERVGPAHHSD